MSSILIKNTEMPKSCDTCFLSRWDFIERFHCPFDECPLVEVPTPHGRLIDADALDYKLGASDRDIYVRGVLEEDAPTVIEAEGENE